MLEFGHTLRLNGDATNLNRQCLYYTTMVPLYYTYPTSGNGMTQSKTYK